MKRCAAEFFGTFALVFAGTGAIAIDGATGGGVTHVGVAVSTGAKEKGITAGIAVGAAVALGALFAGPVSGASMNPARSLGPALVTGRLAHLWIYLLAPVAGAGAAVLACRCVREVDCCRPAPAAVSS